MQIVAFLSSLRVSAQGGLTLIVCPASTLLQWLRECHKWAPELRVILLHETGRHKASHQQIIRKLNDACLIPASGKKYCGGVLITTYCGLQRNDALLLPIKWGFVVLDEGHKIRNPNANITMTCKQIKCRHRMILSGSPLQNTLIDLWSLFDFCYHGRLGELPVFEQEFVEPIKCGGYTHANNSQIEASIACANALKDIVDPYILRRTKEDIKDNLNVFIPNKTEQVLFCNMTKAQTAAYKQVLNSNEMKIVFDNQSSNSFYFDEYDRRDQRSKSSKGMTFKIITLLRKIVNHPDLLHLKNKHIISQLPIDYGSVERSAKLQVLSVVLAKWKEEGHRALIFCQTKQFLDIIERFVSAKGFVFMRLDGSTPVRNRQRIISEFNDNSEIFLMLLTTKAGGLGINLIGANRVIVADAAWNPSTDSQSKERCYRLGQQRDVTIYRLIVRGSIEEKIYQRQIYKQFLTDKVLKDPNSSRCFSEKDLKNLFSLSDEVETEQLFNDVNANITPKDISDDGGKRSKDETEILSLLFSSNGIASALRHGYAEELDENERIANEQKAKKVAKRALKALEKSRKRINEHPIFQPTWTGNKGFNHNVIDDKRKKFGNHKDLIHILRNETNKNEQSDAMSSAKLLAQIKARKAVVQNEKNGDEQQRNYKVKDLKNKRYEVLVRDLYNFVKQSGERGVESDTIIQHFDHRLHTEQEQMILKMTLQRMCRLVAKTRGTKCWVLKEKYKSL